MRQEDKELLLKDLGARLSYGVKISVNDKVEILQGIDISDNVVSYDSFLSSDIEEIKPYLFPISSVSEDQAKELFDLFGISMSDSMEMDYIKINECTGITFFLNRGFDVETHLDKLIDWLNAHHFDYRYLIEKGLAIDASNLNIY